MKKLSIGLLLVGFCTSVLSSASPSYTDSTCVSQTSNQHDFCSCYVAHEDEICTQVTAPNRPWKNYPCGNNTLPIKSGTASYIMIVEFKQNVSTYKVAGLCSVAKASHFTIPSLQDDCVDDSNKLMSSDIGYCGVD